MSLTQGRILLPESDSEEFTLTLGGDVYNSVMFHMSQLHMTCLQPLVALTGVSTTMFLLTHLCYMQQGVDVDTMLSQAPPP